MSSGLLDQRLPDEGEVRVHRAPLKIMRAQGFWVEGHRVCNGGLKALPGGPLIGLIRFVECFSREPRFEHISPQP